MLVIQGKGPQDDPSPTCLWVFFKYYRVFLHVLIAATCVPYRFYTQITGQSNKLAKQPLQATVSPRLKVTQVLPHLFKHVQLYIRSSVFFKEINSQSHDVIIFLLLTSLGEMKLSSLNHRDYYGVHAANMFMHKLKCILVYIIEFYHLIPFVDLDF